MRPLARQDFRRICAALLRCDGEGPCHGAPTSACPRGDVEAVLEELGASMGLLHTKMDMIIGQLAVQECPERDGEL
jgi:hypothetical protein